MNKNTAWAAALALPMLMAAAGANAQPAASPGTTVPNAAPGGISPGAPAPAMRAPGNTGPASPAMPSAAGINPNAATAGSPANLSAADKTFITKAAIGGMAEVQLAQLAQQKSQSEKVKTFAQKMIDDHTPNNAELMKIASAKGATPPAELDAMHQQEMTKLQGLNGAKFDRMYLHGQARDHAMMLKTFQTEASHGKDADLKQFAQTTIPTIESHEEMAKSDAK